MPTRISNIVLPIRTAKQFIDKGLSSLTPIKYYIIKRFFGNGGSLFCFENGYIYDTRPLVFSK